jgi:hypothetical protein
MSPALPSLPCGESHIRLCLLLLVTRCQSCCLVALVCKLNLGLIHLKRRGPWLTRLPWHSALHPPLQSGRFCHQRSGKHRSSVLSLRLSHGPASIRRAWTRVAPAAPRYGLGNVIRCLNHAAALKHPLGPTLAHQQGLVGAVTQGTSALMKPEHFTSVTFVTDTAQLKECTYNLVSSSQS